MIKVIGRNRFVGASPSGLTAADLFAIAQQKNSSLSLFSITRQDSKI